MQYILNILDEQKQRLEEKNKRTEELLNMYLNNVKKLQKENVKELINIAEVQQKIDRIKTDNEELFARAWLDGYTIKKEHKYYARIKGWENVTTGSEAFNWVYFKEKDTVGISKAVENKYQAVSFTKYDWNNLGVNKDNADFVLVEELEE